VQALFGAIVAGLFAVAGLSPIATLVPAMLGFGTLAVLILQALAAISIVVWFRRQRDPRWWSTFIAPGLGFLGLSTIVVLAVIHFDIVAGSTNPFILSLPLLLVVAIAGGIVYGRVLRKNKPEIYDALATDLEKFNVHAAEQGKDPVPGL
jgi:hypothetical protein